MGGLAKSHKKKKVAKKKDEFNKHMGTHCDDHSTGPAYQDMEAAQKACVENQQCSGVYDNKCDGLTTQFGSKMAGFRLCDKNFALSSSDDSCVYELTRGDSGSSSGSGSKTHSKKKGFNVGTFTQNFGQHCDDHTIGKAYQTMIDAEVACRKNKQCSGVYDNKCDGLTTQFGSKAAGFRLCDSNFDLASSEDSCVYEKDHDLTAKLGGKWVKSDKHHCDDTSIGKAYMEFDEAIKACGDNDMCAGVYDNYCDGK